MLNEYIKQTTKSICLNRSKNSTTAEGHYVTYISYLCSHFISNITYQNYTCKRGSLIRTIIPIICFTAKTEIDLLRVEFASVSKYIIIIISIQPLG